MQNEYTQSELLALWDALGDIAIDDDECIESDFIHFEAGTDRYIIWHWFDEKYSLGVAHLQGLF
jgi:hypothetical protein